ncbi:MAG: Wzz/FepE/Etk N-terminal domain-containing protein [Ekhidna sp.]
MEETGKTNTEYEIDLKDLARDIWLNRLFIVKISAFFFVFGLVIAFTAKIEYIASCKLMPENQEGVSSDLGGLGGLAGLAGINLNMAKSGSLPPELYPEIVKSSPFLQNLINTSLYFERIDTTITSFDYFKNERPSFLGLLSEYTIGLPGKLKNVFSSAKMEAQDSYSMMRFSKEEWNIIQGYADRLNVSVDPKTTIIRVSTQMPDPVAAAQLANILVLNLTNDITKYRVEKEENNLLFISERFADSKENYQVKQRDLARFIDRNRNISNSIVKTEYERLQNEMNISFEVYKGLATQLEQARIKVKEKTPVFTILEPVKIPVERSSPNRKLLILSITFLGVIVSTLYIAIKSIIKK